MSAADSPTGQDPYAAAVSTAAQRVTIPEDRVPRIAAAIWALDDPERALFSTDQRTALAVHLAAFLDRRASGEALPAIEPALIQELSADSLQRARTVLTELVGTDPGVDEAALVAVHRDAASITARSSS